MKSIKTEQHPFSLEHLGIPAGSPHTCPYLHDRGARERAFVTDKLPASFYESLMDYGWRRSGNVVYRPACNNCSECRAVRVASNEFEPNRTQRRVWKKNQDIEARIGPCKPTPEKFDLFLNYQQDRHTGKMCSNWHDFVMFLYFSPVETLEVEFYLKDKLIGASIIDCCPHCISAVYTYFSPGFYNRSLGTYAILWAIDYAQSSGRDYYYMGYYIRDCRKMNYKTNFRPVEINDGQGNWSPIA